MNQQSKSRRSSATQLSFLSCKLWPSLRDSPFLLRSYFIGGSNPLIFSSPTKAFSAMKDLDGYIDVLSCYNQTPLRSANFFFCHGPKACCLRYLFLLLPALNPCLDAGVGDTDHRPQPFGLLSIQCLPRHYVLMPGTTDLVLLCLEKILLSRTCGVDITMLGLLQLLEAWRVVLKPFWVAYISPFCASDEANTHANCGSTSQSYVECVLSSE